MNPEPLIRRFDAFPRASFPLALALACLFSPRPTVAEMSLARWRYLRPVEVERTDKGIIRVRIDTPIYETARPDLSDLRILDRGNREIPYVIRTEQGSRRVTRLFPQLFNRTYQPGKSSSVTLFFGRMATKNSLVIRTKGENFRREVVLEASTDAKHWERLREPAFLLRVTEMDDGEPIQKDRIVFPPSHHQYLKITVFNDRSDPARLEIEEVHAEEVVEVPPLLESVSVQRVSTRQEEDRTEVFFDTGVPHRPLHALRFDFEERNFYRRAELWGRNAEVEEVNLPREDAAELKVEREAPWHRLAGVVLYRFDTLNGEESDLEMSLEGAGYRFLRLRIYNDDDSPLRLRAVRAEAVVQSLMFPAAAGKTYTLYYGNSEARRPSYDLTRFLSNLEEVQVTEAGLGAVRENPAYGGPIRSVAWTERHPGILWGALFVAVGILGYLIYRLAKSGRSGS